MKVEEQLLLVELRLRTLESSQRRWRRAAIGVATLALLMTLTAQLSAPAVVEARTVVVRDDHGSARIQLGIAEDAPNLSLYDAGGTLRAGLVVEPEGPILNLFTAAGEPRLVLGERGDSSFVILHDRDGAPRAAMAVQADGSPSLYLLDAKLNPLFKKP